MSRKIVDVKNKSLYNWVDKHELLFRKHQMPTAYSSSFIGWSKSIYSSPMNTMFDSPLHPLIYRNNRDGIGFIRFAPFAVFYLN